MSISTRTRAGAVVAVIPVAVAVSGCSSNALPDPFKDGVSRAGVVIDRVDCDPTPDMCRRYVVLRPIGISTAALSAVVVRTARSALDWRPTRYPEVVDSDMGSAFDGPTRHSPGGTVNTVGQELHYWRRVGLTSGTPPHTSMLAVEHAMEATPQGVVVCISGGA